ncbi:Transmembrane 9 super member 1 [Desmophyllum pertusum]|uniref:Multifunctional fusion protein n=1 Tax=Desmophyllum pertusum TaxID=174260 RepID=A0A9W9YHW0_9CNID|nr:Transmembrane 9 super member 1 [Desmophyllum pertusum]
MGQLASYLDNNVPLLTRVSNVKKLHQTLELVVTAKSVTRLGHENLRSLTQSALTYYQSHPDSQQPVFSLSLPAFGSTSGAAVKSICASSNPAVWCVAIKSKTKIGSHTTIVQLSTSHPGNIGVSESPGYDDTELNDEDFDPDKDQFQYFLSCAKQVEHRSLTLGEVLDGDRMAVAMHEIMFKEQVQNKELCTVSLNRKEIGQLQEAIEDLYYFEFVLDDLPLRGFIGHLEESGFLPHSHKVFLWAHLNFNIEFNGDQIISANVSTANHQPVSLDDVQLPFKVQFTYSVMWSSINTPYAERLKIQRWWELLSKEFGVLVFLLMGFVVIILMRVLKNDFAKYNISDDDEIDDIDQDEVWLEDHSRRCLQISALQKLALCYPGCRLSIHHAVCVHPDDGLHGHTWINEYSCCSVVCPDLFVFQDMCPVISTEKLVEPTGCGMLCVDDQYFFQVSEHLCKDGCRGFLPFSSTSVFVFGYAMFYYYKRSNMSGMLQSVQFFGYYTVGVLCVLPYA